MSGRKLTPRRRLLYACLTPVAKGLIRALWATCRITHVEGEQRLAPYMQQGKPVIFCYWHGLQLFCVKYIFSLQKKGLHPGFLISPSVDGEVPARIVTDWGAAVVRASTTRSGAKALRDIYQLIQSGISPVTSPDGPTGPIYEFKPGAIMLSQFSKTPMVPMSYAASRAWRLRTWDRFVIPKPFSRVAIVVGEPRLVEGTLNQEKTEALQQEMNEVMKTLYLKAKQAVSP